MLKTSTRLLRLLSLLQSRRHWTGADLCERLEVDARTVRRDVDRLRELGYPVQASTGVGGGYRLAAGASLPPLLLDDDEAVAMVVALRSATASVARIEDTAVGLLGKLDQLLPARLRRRVSALYSVTVSLKQREEGPDVETLTELAGACRDHLLIEMDYNDRGGRATRRTIEPLRLVSSGRRWYLLAWDRSREDWRLFRADRIQAARCGGGGFVPRVFPEDVAAYVQRAISQPLHGPTVRARLRGSAESLTASLPPWCGVLEHIDEHSCLLHVRGETPEEILALLALTGVEFELVDAGERRPELRAVAERLLRAVQ
ncbi:MULTISPECIES: helix-turn-helix transcriptional regulator [Lysobacter]|jgi:predicted DNA-binding transcriptional regulator YafY|uniref:YafY family transcriptional regulator n=1 Tax=Lysobacter gummosus TaxID=262324 RepID=A0ABY3XDZ9_9GAMM|nr:MULTISPECIES: YafY family protein [Lysobacter]ALN89538.1 deoR-like helix-turn-helix domain protein [Lysobacter gummosus]UJB18546.1 YafY family transcriptional regulator [Lysobacter capsici]UJQ27729.1 YafY family transcriptional regulator [Lysobacter gummosus]UNP30176.1 YafY family transcriptional regulator [Lysobacter gummosus]